MQHTNTVEKLPTSRETRNRTSGTPRILLCLDRSELSETILSYAVTLTRAVAGSLTLMHVVESPCDASSNVHDVLVWELKRHKARQYLDQLLKRIGNLDVPATLQIGEGKAAEQILGFIRQNPVDFVILSSHGTHGLAEWSLSSTAAKVVGRTHSSFIIVPATPMYQHAGMETSIRRILVPLDDSLASQACLPIAIRIARHKDAELILMHAIEPATFTHLPGMSRTDLKIVDDASNILESTARKYFNQIAERLRNDGLRVSVVIEPNSNPIALISKTITDMDVDFIAMSAHGSSGSEEYPLARTSAHMASHTPVPLLIVQDLEKEKIAKALIRRRYDRVPSRNSKPVTEETG